LTSLLKWFCTFIKISDQFFLKQEMFQEKSEQGTQRHIIYSILFDNIAVYEVMTKYTAV